MRTILFPYWRRKNSRINWQNSLHIMATMRQSNGEKQTAMQSIKLELPNSKRSKILYQDTQSFLAAGLIMVSFDNEIGRF